MWSFTPISEIKSKKRCSMKKGIPKTFAKFTWKHLCQSIFFNKTAGLRTVTLKNRIWHRRFPVNFAKNFKDTFLREHLRTTASVKQSSLTKFSLISEDLLPRFSGIPQFGFWSLIIDNFYGCFSYFRETFQWVWFLWQSVFKSLLVDHIWMLLLL